MLLTYLNAHMQVQLFNYSNPHHNINCIHNCHFQFPFALVYWKMTSCNVYSQTTAADSF